MHVVALQELSDHQDSMYCTTQLICIIQARSNALPFQIKPAKNSLPNLLKGWLVTYGGD